MTKDVLVSIKGLQYLDGDDGNKDEIETIYPGEYYFRNGAHYVLYEENMEGIDGIIKNMVKVKDKEFVLNKKGPVTMQMVFAEGKKTMTDYITPFGNIMVAFDTSLVEVQKTEDKFKVHIEYALEANYQFVADCNIFLEVSSKE